MRAVYVLQMASASVIVAWLASAAFLLAASKQFDMAQAGFILTYWGIPVTADLVLIASLLARSRWRPQLDLLSSRARSLLSGGLLLSAGLTPFVVAAAISGAAAAIGVMAQDQNRFVGTALFASIPIFLLSVLAVMLAVLLWRPRLSTRSSSRASHFPRSQWR